MFTLIPVILAGGEGSGLSPLSSEQSPKQFLHLGKDGESLFAATYKRARMVASSRNIVVVTRKKFGRQIWQEISEIDMASKSQAILEPFSRNTASAVAMAAIHALTYFENPILWIMPSDNYIEKPYSLINAVLESVHAAENDKIVTFGVLPRKTDGNYGHIICGEELVGNNNIFQVKLFLEKPQGKRLEWLMQQKNCVWNSGMSLVSASTILKHIKARGQKILDTTNMAYKKSSATQYGLLVDSKNYVDIPSFSIDKLVMENNENVVVRPVDIGWTDIGTWQNLWEFSQSRSLDCMPLEKFLLYTQNSYAVVSA